MSPSVRRILNWILSVLLAAFIGGLACNHHFYIGSIVSPYFAAALAGAVIIYASIRPYRELAHVAGITVLLWLLEFTFAGVHPRGIFLIVPTVSFAGLASFLLLGIRSIWARGEEQKLLLYGFIPAVIFAASDWFATELLALTERLHPRVYDEFLYSFDASLIVQPGIRLAQLFQTHTWFRLTSTMVYVGLALPIALVYAQQLARKGRAALPVMYAFLITGPLGVVFYNLLPAMGPAHVFQPQFPFFMPDYATAARLLPQLVALPGPRNAIPSLHMGWVLLAWWNSRGLSVATRAVVMFFVIFTVFATLGTGEHYLVDLIVAYPFALFIQAICRTSLPLADRHRFIPATGSLAAILLWFAALVYANRMFWASPSISWLFSLFTVAGAIALNYWMNQASDAVTGAQPALSPAVAK